VKVAKAINAPKRERFSPSLLKRPSSPKIAAHFTAIFHGVMASKDACREADIGEVCFA
jgi:hypothetical protein